VKGWVRSLLHPILEPSSGQALKKMSWGLQFGRGTMW
jgi:hypothetical protein